MLTVYNEESFREVQVVRSCSVLAPGLFAQSGPMCWLGTTGDTKHGFRVFFLFFSVFSVSFGKKTEMATYHWESNVAMFIGFYRCRTLRAFPRGACYLRGSPKKIEHRKKKPAEKEPWADEAPDPWGNIGSGCCMGLLHFSIWTYFFGGMGKQGKSMTLRVRMSADYFIRSNFGKNERTNGG